MDKMQFMGLIFMIGSILGVLALLASAAWHKIDNHLSELEPNSADSWEETQERWNKWERVREYVRIFGLICMYSSFVAMIIGAFGIGLLMMEKVQ